MQLYLVRHAKARPKKGWKGSDADRPLDDKGFWQAPKIAESILESGRGREITAIYSSPSLRCQQTLEPLAGKLSLGVEARVLLGDTKSGPPAPIDAEETPASRLLGLRGLFFVDDCAHLHAGEAIAACSHGDLIPGAVAMLCERDGVELPDNGNDKGSIWTLEFDGPRLKKASYAGAP